MTGQSANLTLCLGRLVSRVRNRFACACLVYISLIVVTSAVAQDDNEFFQKKIIPRIHTFCFDCHSGEGSEGDIDLEKFKTLEDVQADLETWAHVLSVIRAGDMPPEGETPLTDHEKAFLQKWIVGTIEKSKDQQKPLGAIRRLSRFEYENTIRDLFRLERTCFNNPARIVQTTDYFNPATAKMPAHVFGVSYFFNSHRRHSDLPGVATLPVDPPVEHGFANDQEALSLSPLLMENYLDISTALLNAKDFKQICGIWNSLMEAEEPSSKESMLAQAEANLNTFLPRAFRRPVTAAEIQRYIRLFQIEFEESGSYQASMKTVLSAVLVSPNFLYRSEHFTPEIVPEAPTVKTMDESYALASKLSYFLWGSMPDDELFQAAREKSLLTRNGLLKQVDRMMVDRRVKSLSIDFGMQWLKVQKANSLLPDKDKYPDYYDGSVPPPAISMMIEQLLLFETIMIEDRSILEFITADYGYLNRQLMNWYQLDPQKVLGFSPPVKNFEDFFRIKWHNGHRGGVITSGVTLLTTSTTKRTSPVYRGAWVLDVVFNSPPPPAPAGVPPLDQAERNGNKKMSVREKLDIHRMDSACASCHDRIDPLGFALESYDAVGRWRKNYETGDEVDTSGTLNSVNFVGPSRFKAAILRKKERFIQAFVEHTLKYALGRQLHFSDEPEVQRIVQKVIDQDCRFHSVIREIVLSDLFHSATKQ